MNGLIIGIAKLRGMQGTCLLGETSGYVVDAKASKSILERLLSVVDIKVDMTNLEKNAKDTERLIQTIQQLKEHFKINQVCYVNPILDTLHK
jgi:uncharacterized protein